MFCLTAYGWPSGRRVNQHQQQRLAAIIITNPFYFIFLLSSLCQTTFPIPTEEKYLWLSICYLIFMFWKKSAFFAAISTPSLALLWLCKGLRFSCCRPPALIVTDRQSTEHPTVRIHNSPYFLKAIAKIFFCWCQKSWTVGKNGHLCVGHTTAWVPNPPQIKSSRPKWPKPSYFEGI